jgi:hypothetical protein
MADLPPSVAAGVLRTAAKVALATGVVVAVRGRAADGDVLLCLRGCCARVPGTWVAVPDTHVVELAANGTDLPASRVRFEADDGRSVAFYRITASQRETRAAPWRHYPHCPAPGCHRRLVDKSGRKAPREYEGERCPHCNADLEREDR